MSAFNGFISAKDCFCIFMGNCLSKICFKYFLLLCFLLFLLTNVTPIVSAVIKKVMLFYLHQCAMFQVLPSILFVKASNAELSESSRFQRLAQADLSELLRKRKMKALIPQIIQMIYFGALSIFFVGSLLVPSVALDGCLLVSFITSVVLLIDPIQVILFVKIAISRLEGFLDKMDVL